MGKKGKRRDERQPVIGRDELADLHAQVKWYCQWKGCKPGSEGYSLLCQIGAALGNWPRVKTALVLKIRQRTAALIGERASEQPAVKTPRKESVPQRRSGWEGCPNCKVLIRVGARHECARFAPARKPPAPSPVQSKPPPVQVEEAQALEDDMPKGEPRTVCGIHLNAYEVPPFDEACRRGELVIGPETPVNSPLVAAWQLWCRSRSQPCRVREVTWREVAQSLRG